VQFGDIPRAIETALVAEGNAPSHSREALLAADEAARRRVRELFAC
jgi:hypothetical protein